MAMLTQIDALSLQPHRAFTRPGEMVRWTLKFQSSAAGPARLQLVITHLEQVLWTEELQVALLPGVNALEMGWLPPAEAPCGYGLDACLLAPGGARLAGISCAFDVLEHWTQAPRYGFLTDFSPGRVDADETMDVLLGYQINALQFYDWMYRHDTLLAESEPYEDPLGRLLARRTVDALIAAAHARGIAALPYTAVYAASLEFARQHPDWSLLGPQGEPEMFFDFLALMDPRPDRPWTRHLLDQYALLLEATAFDGIHIDQYGDPKTGYDATGKPFDLAHPLAEFINATRRVVDARRANGAVIFNSVGNWPVEAVAPARQDLVYIEVWPPDNEFADLQRIIEGAQALGGGKAVVLAAYISPSVPVNVRLANAVIFASGGAHIELGERTGGAPNMLADPYFPKHEAMPPGLAADLLRQVNFAVRYQELLGPRTTADPLLAGHVRLNGPESARVSVIARKGMSGTALSLVNFSGLAHTCWNQPLGEAPRPVSGLRLELELLSQSPAAVYYATPDSESLELISLPFKVSAGKLAVELPELACWGMVFIHWK